MNERGGGGSVGLISFLAARSAFQPYRAGEGGGPLGRRQTVEPPPGRQIKRKEGLLSLSQIGKRLHGRGLEVAHFQGASLLLSPGCREDSGRPP